VENYPLRTPKHTEVRHKTFYAVLSIPKDVRPSFGGKIRFIQSLKTDSFTEAEDRSILVVHQWKRLIAAARSGRVNPSSHSTTSFDRTPTLTSIVDKACYMPLETVIEPAAAPVKLSDHLEAHLERQRLLNHENGKSIDSRRSNITKLLLSKFTYSHEIDQKTVKKWVISYLFEELGLSKKTVKTKVSHFNLFWSYLADEFELEGTPFKDVLPKTTRNKRELEQHQGERQSFSVEDFQKLVSRSEERQDNQLADLIRLGAYTGARIEEICSLKVSDINTDKGFFTVTASKTEAGIRQIPIHPAIRQLVARLIETSKDGYLLSGLTNNKYGDRSNAIGKRFGRLKNSLGYGRELVFHSFRRGVATQFESAKIPEVLAARILGHDFPTMSFGVYSGGADIETLRGSIEVLKW